MQALYRSLSRILHHLSVFHSSDRTSAQYHLKLELPDILNTPRAQAIREGFSRRRPAEDLCRRCGYAQRFSL